MILRDLTNSSKLDFRVFPFSILRRVRHDAPEAGLDDSELGVAPLTSWNYFWGATCNAPVVFSKFSPRTWAPCILCPTGLILCLANAPNAFPAREPLNNFLNQKSKSKSQLIDPLRSQIEFPWKVSTETWTCHATKRCIFARWIRDHVNSWLGASDAVRQARCQEKTWRMHRLTSSCLSRGGSR